MNKNFFASLGSTIAAQFRGLDSGNPSSWPLVPRLFLLLVLYCLTVGLLWLYPLSDYDTELEKAVEKENTLRAEFTDKLGKAANLNLLKKQRDEVALTVEGLEKQLPNSTEMSGLLFSISQMGRGQNLQQELFKPDAPIFKTYYAIIPVTFRANGSYHDFARFAADVANLPRIVNLSNMTISPKAEGALTLETTVRTYRYLDPGEVAAQTKNPKEGK
jgi:type IV pilus assembly protein PilO